jgi:hypothetical protein
MAHGAKKKKKKTKKKKRGMTGADALDMDGDDVSQSQAPNLRSEYGEDESNYQEEAKQPSKRRQVSISKTRIIDGDGSVGDQLNSNFDLHSIEADEDYKNLKGAIGGSGFKTDKKAGRNMGLDDNRQQKLQQTEETDNSGMYQTSPDNPKKALIPK